METDPAAKMELDNYYTERTWAWLCTTSGILLTGNFFYQSFKDYKAFGVSDLNYPMLLVVLGLDFTGIYLFTDLDDTFNEAIKLYNMKLRTSNLEFQFHFNFCTAGIDVRF